MKLKALKIFHDPMLGGWVRPGQVFEYRDDAGYDMLKNRIAEQTEEPVAVGPQAKPVSHHQATHGKVTLPVGAVDQTPMQVLAAPVPTPAVPLDHQDRSGVTVERKQEDPGLAPPPPKHVILAPDATERTHSPGQFYTPEDAPARRSSRRREG